MSNTMTDADIVNLWEDTVGDSGCAPEDDELATFARAVVEKFGSSNESAVIERLLRELAVRDIAFDNPLFEILDQFKYRSVSETEVLNRFRETLEHRGYKPIDEPLFAILDQYAALTTTPVEASLLADEGLRERVTKIIENPGKTVPRPQRHNPLPVGSPAIARLRRQVNTVRNIAELSTLPDRAVVQYNPDCRWVAQLQIVDDQRLWFPVGCTGGMTEDVFSRHLSNGPFILLHFPRGRTA